MSRFRSRPSEVGDWLDRHTLASVVLSSVLVLASLVFAAWSEERGSLTGTVVGIVNVVVWFHAMRQSFRYHLLRGERDR